MQAIQMSLNILQCQRQLAWKIDDFTMLNILWVSCFVRQNQYEFLYMAILDYYRSRTASKIPSRGIGQQIQQKQLEAEFAVSISFSIVHFQQPTGRSMNDTF
jgi:hypothetical protein